MSWAHTSSGFALRDLVDRITDRQTGLNVVYIKYISNEINKYIRIFSFLSFLEEPLPESSFKSIIPDAEKRVFLYGMVM